MVLIALSCPLSVIVICARKDCGYGEFFNSSRAFSANNIGVKGAIACGTRNIGKMRLSETPLSKTSVLILLFYNSLSNFYYNTC